MPIHKKDLDELLHAKVISADTATAIQNYYHDKKSASANPMLAIFASLGGILVGLGVILIFAHNWDNFSRSIKALLAFLPLVISQVFTGYCIFKNKSAAFKETAAVLVFFSVGASISLIAQIYNISGDFPQFILTWTLLCAPLMYLLRSSAAVVLHLIISTVFVLAKGYWSYPYNDPYAYLLLIAIVIPYYYQLVKTEHEGRMALTLHILVPVSLIIASNIFFSRIADFSILLLVVFYGLLYSVGKLNGLGRAYKIFGAMGLMGLLFFLSFREMWNDLVVEFVPVGYGIVFVLMLAGILLIAIRSIRAKDFDPIQFVSVVVLLLYLVSIASNGLAAILCNLLVLAAGLWYVKKGIDDVKYLTVNFGLLAVAILAGCRFFDTDLTFVVRGLLFVGVGAGFFVANYAVSKRKQTIKKQPYEN